ncbi:hypothetical protein EDC04DRAFT_2709858 [Pisolithus marmoratus]|nr:hypothetical protein EDC04DRAFT_2709858 [Pisolithus marmoratus]
MMRAALLCVVLDEDRHDHGWWVICTYYQNVARMHIVIAGLFLFCRIHQPKLYMPTIITFISLHPLLYMLHILSYVPVPCSSSLL